MNFEKKSLKLLEKAIDKLDRSFDLPSLNPKYDYTKMEQVMEQLVERFADNFPYHHPLYAGQMLKPPHPMARIAYQLAMWINPNNHAIDGSRASSPMEKEVVNQLAGLFGMHKHLGHLTSGGTVANLEALWIAGKEHEGHQILASEQAHYTHQRVTEVLRIPFSKVRCDSSGRMDVNHLEEKLKAGDVGTVVVTMGTTGLGMVDPLSDILDLQKTYNFRIHADAAYGGYFRLASNLKNQTVKDFKHLEKVDSLVIDPHKHGLQPYGCGCVLFSDAAVARHYIHDSPYTYFTSDELHLGEISLECSRAGATAVALWATHQMYPPVAGGEFSEDLEKCRTAALLFKEHIQSDDRFILVNDPDLDIVVWAIRGKNTREMSEKADKLFSSTAKQELHLSKVKIPAKMLGMAGEHVTCLRTCLMKPEHLDWMEEIWNRLKF